MRFLRFLRRQLLQRYAAPGSAPAFHPSQDDVVRCAAGGRTFGGGDHDRRGDTNRPSGAYGGAGGF